MKRVLNIIIPLVLIAFIADYYRLIIPNQEDAEILIKHYSRYKLKEYKTPEHFYRIASPTNHYPFYSFTLYHQLLQDTLQEKIIYVTNKNGLQVYHQFDEFIASATYDLEITNHFGDKMRREISAPNKTETQHLDQVHRQFYYKSYDTFLLKNAEQDTIVLHFSKEGSNEDYISAKIFPKDENNINVTVMSNFNTKKRIRNYTHFVVANDFLMDFRLMVAQFNLHHKITPGINQQENLTIITNQNTYQTYTTNHQFGFYEWLIRTLYEYDNSPQSFKIPHYDPYDNPYL